MALPQTAQCRQIVGADGHQRLARVLGRRLEAASIDALEQERTVGKNPGCIESGLKTLGYRSKVFTDHQALVALTFEGDDAEQVLQRAGYIASLGRWLARRYPENARQSDNVIDSQRPALPHIGAQNGNEGGIGRIAQPMRNEGRQTPILTIEIEIVGRRTGIGVFGKDLLVGPVLGATRIHPQSQILIQPHAQTAPRCMLSD